MEKKCGSLYFLKNGVKECMVDLELKESYTVGTVPNANIRLKMHTLQTQSQYSIIKVDDAGFVSIKLHYY